HFSLTTRSSSIFFFIPTPTPEIYTLSLHDALPISARRWSGSRTTGSSGPDPGRAGSRLARRGRARRRCRRSRRETRSSPDRTIRSEEHTSELQSRSDLVCRLLLEKKKKKKKIII